jgi:hypothetical protein
MSSRSLSLVSGCKFPQENIQISENNSMPSFTNKQGHFDSSGLIYNKQQEIEQPSTEVRKKNLLSFHFLASIIVVVLCYTCAIIYDIFLIIIFTIEYLYRND